jgi:hypothetical protein
MIIMSTPIPAMFEGFDVIEGFEPIDKAELVGRPFGITGVRFRENERKVTFAEIEIIDVNGQPGAFQDSSTTGARDQLARYLTDKGIPLSSEWTDVRLFVPRGLRVSEYDAPVDDSGKVRKAKTYYLTTEGRKRPEVGSAGADRPQRTRTAQKAS